MTQAIACRGLEKKYAGKPPVEAVRGVDLDVEQGCCFGILGPNGAGKTTTIEILEGLLPATTGEVKILGLSWEDSANEIRQRIGISLQETKLSDKLTVRETLELFRSFYSSGIRTEEAIAKVSLQEKASTWVQKLSGGQKQRLAVASALVGNPDLLFLDEPTTGLDPQSRRELWEIIRENKHKGRTILLTTHYMEEAEKLCDQVAIFDEGKVIALGSPRELIAGLGGDHVIEFSLEATRATEGNWSGIPSVTDVHAEEDSCKLSVEQPHVAIPHLLSYISDRNWALSALTTRHASLDDVFVKLTGRQIDNED